MATFSVVGFDELERDLLRHSENMEKAIPKMLKAGAQVLIKAQKGMIERMAYDKGTLASSITASPVYSKSTSSYLNVYPSGYQPHGTPGDVHGGKVRNAQVGFTLEYGRPLQGVAPIPWMSAAIESSRDEIHEVMLKVLEAETDE
jgi:hypothetical protein